MDTYLVLDKIYPLIINYMLITTRISTFIFTFNLFRKGMASVKVLISLAFIMSFYVIMLYDHSSIAIDVLSLHYFMATLTQIVIGFCGGLILNIAIEVFAAVGQIVSTQVGLSAASLFDPKFGMITSLTTFYIITFIVIFLAMNGHLIMLQAVISSFKVLPVNILVTNFHGEAIAKFSSIIFTGSLLISLTIVAAILLTNISLAIMSKFAPQFNLFSVGLNMSILIGLVCVYLSFELMVDKSHDYVADVINFLMHYMNEIGSHVR